MRTLFLNPPSLYTDNVLKDVMYGCWCKGKRIGGALTPPHPLVSMATVIKHSGHEVSVLDAPAQGVGLYRLKKMIEDFDSVVILTSVMSFKEDCAILRELKDSNPRLRSIVAGAETTFMPEFCLKSPSVDVIIRGEPEFCLRDLIQAMDKGGEEWKKVLGIGYREGEKHVLNDRYPLIANLDELPFTDWSLLKHSDDYFYPLVSRLPYVEDLTTRGCPKRCMFCMAPPFYGNKVRGRSAGNVIQGIEHVVEQGFKEIYFRDEMFTTLKKRNVEICHWLINNKVDITWFVSAAIGWIDRDMMRMLKEAGCHTLKIGVESGSQKILDNIRKEITVEQTRDTFRWAHEVGINTHAHLMIGNPGETKETIEETIRFVKEIDPTTASFGMSTPYPGTELFELAAQKRPEIRREFGLDTKTLHEFSYYTDSYCELTAEELAYYEKKIHREFYMRSSYLWKWLRQIDSIYDLKRVTRAGFNVLDFSVRGDG